MPTVEAIESWRGQDVLDIDGEKVGRLEEVYYDTPGREPVLVSIKRGRLGHQVKLVPLSDVAVSRDYLRLPFSGDQIDGHPTSPSGTSSPPSSAPPCARCSWSAAHRTAR